MELFSSQPDLTLQISPPNSKTTSAVWRREADDHRVREERDLGFWKRALDSRISSISNSTVKPGTTPPNCFELSLLNQSSSHSSSCSSSEPYGSNLAHHPLENPTTGNNGSNDAFQANQLLYHRHQLQQQQYHHGRELGFLRPIRGIPVNQSHPPPPYFSFAPHPLSNRFCLASTLPDISAIHRTRTAAGGGVINPHNSHHFRRQGLTQSRFLSRFPAKRSTRAPRMRWTSSLHTRFVHAVELLGGHERATPKSVLELMDVNDITLAHVKSHLQMYRTVKTTDRSAASSGRSDASENGSFADKNRSSELSLQQGRQNVNGQEKDYHRGLWSSSSREAWLHGKQKESERNMQSPENDLEAVECLSYEPLSDVSSSNHSETSQTEPNLEFTLGS
ncbi:hypothetical protein Nepgr_030642 [Nepenthes gracilis]|uniref:Myb-like domain-containing protein n=1 Tax=Nepenthes gracilis TaxID=150966 RepID=A0AAD3Y692_NEPGR|nr:hypothetical protein Nepgr_030642 [Nepenthes gracilis]